VGLRENRQNQFDFAGFSKIDQFKFKILKILKNCIIYDEFLVNFFYNISIFTAKNIKIFISFKW
jgi:hypothetical protein